MASAGLVQLLLGRRPQTVAAAAFGHVDVSQRGSDGLSEIVEDVLGAVRGKKQVTYHPDDQLDDHEVMVLPLAGFDRYFQPNAVWSLERAIAELRRPRVLQAIDGDDIRAGAWGFYVIRVKSGSTDIALLRAKSPTYGLGEDKFVGVISNAELKPVKEPLITFDHAAELMVINDKVYVLRPRPVERLFVDADAVKARAPQTTRAFAGKLAARLAPGTIDAIQAAISNNANVGRRVERLTRDVALDRVTDSAVRRQLPKAGLGTDAFGKGGPIQAVTERMAVVFIDIAADLYYQPTFDDAPRRVAAYRKVG